MSTLTPVRFDDLTAHLSDRQQAKLRQGKPVVTRSTNKFVGQIMAQAMPDVVWDVLTDYEHFSEFLPTVVSSRVLSVEGDRHIVEQIDARQVFLTTIRSRVQTETIERPPERIDFRLLEGDLKAMSGHWQLAPILESEGTRTHQTLITQTVVAESGTGPFEGLFHSIFGASLKENLRAVQTETQRRR